MIPAHDRYCRCGSCDKFNQAVGDRLADEPYVISDERLREIRTLVRPDASPVAWARNVQLAAAIYDLLAERDDRTV